jgi:WD40 repeat protein
VGKRTGETPLIHAHSGEIADLTFSHFNDSLLASSSDDATVKIWQLPHECSSTNLIVCCSNFTLYFFEFSEWISNTFSCIKWPWEKS